MLSIRYLVSILVISALMGIGSAGKADVFLQEFDISSAEFLMLESINIVRYEHGLPLLLLDRNLSTVSRRHALDMAHKDYFDHFSPDGQGPEDRVRLADLPYTVCENIGIMRSFGQDSKQVVDALMDSFLASPEHLVNILNPDVTHIGIGFSQDIDSQNHQLESGRDPGTNYTGFGTVLVVQDFCRRNVRILEPCPFSGTTREGQFLEMKLEFAESVQEAFLRLIPEDSPGDAFEVPLTLYDDSFRARFAIDRPGKFTIAIYANSRDENWFYREHGRLELEVQPF